MRPAHDFRSRACVRQHEHHSINASTIKVLHASRSCLVRVYAFLIQKLSVPNVRVFRGPAVPKSAPKVRVLLFMVCLSLSVDRNQPSASCYHLSRAQAYAYPFIRMVRVQTLTYSCWIMDLIASTSQSNAHNFPLFFESLDFRQGRRGALDGILGL